MFKTILFTVSKYCKVSNNISINHLLNGNLNNVVQFGKCAYSKKSLCGKIGIITGAANGMGAEIAFKLVDRGACLTITDKDEKNLEIVANKCEEISCNRPVTVAGDITKEEVTSAVVKATIEQYEKIDILVNNAGMFRLGGISSNMSTFDELFRTNVRSLYHLTQLSVPHLIKTRGNVVNFSSMAGKRPFIEFFPYCMTKAAVKMFTELLSLEMASKGVRVNAVNPGVIDTKLFHTAFGGDAKVKEFFEIIGKKHPIGRIGQAEEVAELVAFLADNSLSGFITGENVSIDGGYQNALP